LSGLFAAEPCRHLPYLNKYRNLFHFCQTIHGNVVVVVVKHGVHVGQGTVVVVVV